MPNPETQPTLPNASREAALLALLFTAGNSIKRVTLARDLACTKEELATTLATLHSRLKDSGLSLIETESEVSLATAPEVSSTIAEVRQQAFSTEIGQAGLEVISILLYRGSSTRAAIDYVRGVNSVATIRTLIMRGLIERVGKGDREETSYRITPALLQHLGVTEIEQIPEYQKLRGELAQFESRTESMAQETEPLAESAETAENQ